MTLKNKSRQAIVLSCPGKTISIPAQGTAVVPDSLRTCPALLREIQRGTIAIIG